MRISKTTAQAIAKKLTVTKQEQVNALGLYYRQYVKDSYLKQVPKEVSECYQKHKEWFYTTSYVRFEGKGFRYESVAIDENVIANKNSTAYLDLTDTIATKAKKLQNKWLEAQKELNKLQLDIEAALYGLKTFAQIEKNLPEAVPYLPKSTSLELMVNLDTLRSQINKKSL